MSLVMFKSLLADLGQQLGIPDLAAAEDDGHCALALPDDRVVVLEYDDAIEAVTLFCELGTIERQHGEVVLLELLNANVLWSGTGGATLGVHQQTGQVTLGYRVPVKALDTERFLQTIEEFLNGIDHWRQRLDHHNHNPITNEAAAPNSGADWLKI